MKTFKPLFRDNKSSKIIVNGYGTWRKYYKTDFINLSIDYQYKSLPLDEFVYNRKGEQLFFYSYKPNEIKSTRLGDPNCMNWVTVYDSGTHYYCRGLDCDGIPTFSHHDANRVSQNSLEWMEQYEPLTVSMVIMWFDWLMMNKVERVNL